MPFDDVCHVHVLVDMRFSPGNMPMRTGAWHTVQSKVIATRASGGKRYHRAERRCTVGECLPVIDSAWKPCLGNSTMIGRLWCVGLVLWSGLAMTERLLPWTETVHAAGYDRPGSDPKQSRSMIVAKHGIVATSQPLAAQVGLDVLKRGGNAADAAIAANAAIGVVEPMSCGIGGDLFVIYWDAKSQKLYGLNASGRSPFALNRDVFRQKV